MAKCIEGFYFDRNLCKCVETTPDELEYFAQNIIFPYLNIYIKYSSNLSGQLHPVNADLFA